MLLRSGGVSARLLFPLQKTERQRKFAYGEQLGWNDPVRWWEGNAL